MQIIGAVLATVLAAATSVNGHAYISNPLPRARTIPGHFYGNAPQSDGARFSDCRDNGRTGPIQVEWVQGQTVTVEVTVTAYHGGWHELRFCEDARGGNSCFEQNLALVSTPSNVATCPRAAPPSSTHRNSCIPNEGCPSNNKGDCLLDLPPGCGIRNYTFTLPPDLTCDHCAMQWWWITDNFGNEHFKSCHDIAIIPSGGRPPTMPSPTLPPTRSPPGTPPTTPPSATPPPPSGRCDIPIVQNTDYFGADLMGMDAVDEIACCNLCENNSQCAGFTYVPASVGWRQCYLKSSITTVRNTPGMISGQK